MSALALCYIRKSLVRTASDEVSPERQRSNIAREAERRGLVAVFFDDAQGHRSGRSEKGRPGWKLLKARLDDPNVKAVIVESLSRASRSTRDLFNFIAELEKRHIALISLKEDIDTTTAMGKAFVGFIAVLNQFESDIASERMKMTILFKRDEYKQHWGFVPFGCTRRGVERKLAPSREGIWRVGNMVIAGEKDKPPFVDGTGAQWFGYLDAVQKCFELYTSANIGFIDLADQLNTLGYLYRDRYGVPRPFHTDDVRRMVDLVDVYAGNLLRRGANGKPDSVITEAHPRILPSELCEKVVAVHQARHTRWAIGGGVPKRVYLLPNLYCHECGAHLKGQSNHDDRYYRHSDQQKHHCSQSIYVHAEKVESEMFDRLECFQAPEEMKARIRERARKLAKQNAKPEWETARRKLAALDSKLERLKTLFVDGEIDKAEYQRRKTKIEGQKQEISRALPMHPSSFDVKALEDLLREIDQIAVIIHEGKPIQQREVFTALFERVEVLGDKVIKATPREWARPFFNGHENDLLR